MIPAVEWIRSEIDDNMKLGLSYGQESERFVLLE